MIDTGPIKVPFEAMRGTSRRHQGETTEFVGTRAPLRGCGRRFRIHRAAIFDGGNVIDCFNRKELAMAVGQWPLAIQ
jgi:hypothetical protein